jgi:integrase/recombinase XerD
MATLRKMNGKYYVRLRIDGKESLLPTGTTRQDLAEQQLKIINRDLLKVKQNLKTKSELDLKKKTIQDCIKYFFNTYKSEREVTKTTLYTYRLALKDFEKAYENFKYFQDIERKDYHLLVGYLKHRYNSTTVNIRLRGIRAFINYLEDVGYIENRPFKVKEIKADKKLPQYITPPEMDLFYSQITNPKHRATFRTLEYTGMRVGELPNSRRDGDFIYITQSKSKKERIVPIPPQIIQDYDLAINPPLKRDHISHLFTEYIRKAGIKGRTLHSLRHTYALRMLVETSNISFVKELLGHSSVKVTEIYTQFPQEYLKQLFDKKFQLLNSEQIPKA